MQPEEYLGNVNRNHIVTSAKTDTMYDLYDCTYRVRSEIKLSDCVMAEFNPGFQESIKHYAQQRLNDAVQDINRYVQQMSYEPKYRK